MLFRVALSVTAQAEYMHILVVIILVRLGPKGQVFFMTVEPYTRSPPAYEMKVESCPQSGIPPPASFGDLAKCRDDLQGEFVF
jgi:hypothetical protein